MTNEEQIIKYIVLTQMNGIGPVTQNALLDSFMDIDRCFLMDEEELLSSGCVTQIGKAKVKSFIAQRNDRELWGRAEDIIRKCTKAGIEVITRRCGRYPLRFKQLFDMPVLIYSRGQLRINDFASSVGIVGARRCSVTGKDNAIMLATEAVGKNMAVISGMAKGVDSYAHTASIKARGYTVAVLGNGVDICYPKEHDVLYERIASSGCILSEYPPGTQPRNYMFPCRNRLIAAMSDKLYVINAGRNSGTRTTMEKCIRYGREVVEL